MDAGGEESLTTVVLHMESPSIAAVCGMHHALLLRVQVTVHRLVSVLLFENSERNNTV